MAEEAENQEEKPSLFKRLANGLLRTRTGLICLVLGALFSSSMVGYFLFLEEEAEGEKEAASIDRAIEYYQNEQWAEARSESLELVDSPDLKKDEKGLPVFLIGVEIVKNHCDIENQLDRRQGLYLIASRYFDEAALRGVPPHMVPITNYWWGKSLYEAGEIPAARLPLQVALNGLASKRKEILDLLTDVYLEDPKLDPKQGLSYVDSLLDEFRDELDEEQLHRSLVKKARLTSKRFEFQKAIEILKKIPEDSPIASKVTFQIGKVHLDEAQRLIDLRKDDEVVQAAFKKASDTLRNLALIEIDDDQERASSLMDLGLAFYGQGDLVEAEKRFTYVRRQFFDQPVGISAGFYEALCQLRQGQDKKSMDAFGRLLREVVQTNIQGESKWINAPFLNRMVEDAVTELLERDQCEMAVALTKRFREAAGLREPSIPLDTIAEQEVKTYTRWIELLDEDLVNAKHSEKMKLEEQWRDKQRLLGHALFSLARHRFSGKEHALELFQSGEAFFKARDYQRAILTLRQYLDTNDKYQPSKARLIIGQSYFAQRKFDEAIESFSYCWTVHPNDPSVYSARYHSAECYLEQGMSDKAREMLNGNLDDGNLTPRSKEWIESKYLLGNILYEEALFFDAQARALPPSTVLEDTSQEFNKLLKQANGKYDTAIRQLSEALTRKPNLDQAKIGRYQLAESYRRSVAWIKVQLGKTTRNAKRKMLTDSIEGNLNKSISHLDLLEAQLLKIRDTRPLDEIELSLLRNSFFTRGQLYYDLNQYEQSIKMLQSASNMVLQRPEVLEAYVQMAHCYRHLDRKEDVKRVIDQAKILLRDRIPEDADFGATTRFENRERWVQHLEWLGSI